MNTTRNALVLLCITILAAFTPAPAYAARQANDTLLNASSPFEDMAEFALAKNASGITRALAAADKQAALVRKVLPAGATPQFDSMLRALHTAATGKQYYAVAVNSVEVYRLLIVHLDAATLRVPKEVSLLDYAGFKLHVLGAAPQADWGAVRQTTADAAKWWAAIRAKVSDEPLGDAMDSTVLALQQASKLGHLPMLHFAAQMDLDLVDLLEGDFERKKP